MATAWFANRENRYEVWANQRTIAAMAGVSIRATSTGLTELVADELLVELEVKPGENKTYRFVWPGAPLQSVQGCLDDPCNLRQRPLQNADPHISVLISEKKGRSAFQFESTGPAPRGMVRAALAASRSITLAVPEPSPPALWAPD